MSAFWKAFPNRYLIRIEGGQMALPFENGVFFRYFKSNENTVLKKLN